MSADRAAAGWTPDEWWLTHSRLGQFMSEHGFLSDGQADLEGLRRRSVEDPDWFWDATVRFLGLEWFEPYDTVLDESKGIPWATWFGGGTLNLAHNLVDRHAAGRSASRRAIVWEGEDGAVRSWTYGQLRAQADALAALLVERGVGPGDAVGIYMPMVPETVAALLGIAKVGAVFLPLFSGYGAGAVAVRLADAGASALITADGSYRRGAVSAMKPTADEALAQVGSVETVIVVPRTGNDVDMAPGRDLWWPEPGAAFETRAVDSEHPLFIAYTSGTTGRPKGAVHVHGGWLVKVAEEGAFQADCGPDDTLFWFTDMGWIMGPWEVTAALANGATLALFEGAPDWPEPDRLWSFIERHAVTILGISPTLIRALMPHGRDIVARHDLGSLRALGSTGEPWNLEPWRWYFEVVGGGRCPVINISGGTEVGACFLSPHPVEPIKPMSLGGPSLGMAVDVFDDGGRPLRGGQVGELVCTRPWPGMTRGLYQDPERYLDTYWHRWDDVWVHGDWASVADDGQWYLHGRSDDTIKVAGKRLGPAEVESVVVGHDAVVEAAAVGVPDEVKGESLWVYAVLAGSAQPTDDLRAEITALVTDALGKSFKPSVVRFTTALPKTRNAKVLRRAIRAVAAGEEQGDLSSLEDPSTIDAVKAAT